MTTKAENHSQDYALSFFNLPRLIKFLKLYSVYLKGLLSLIICYFIFDRLINATELAKTQELILGSIQSKETWALYAILFVLLPINWGIEAKKWQLLTAKIEPIKFSDCFKSILSGISMNMLAPFGIGDALSRTYFLSSMKRYEAIGSLFINRTSQFIPTLIFGLASIMFLISVTDKNLEFIIAISLLLLIGLFLFFSSIKAIHNFIQEKFNSQFKLLLNSFKYYNHYDLLEISFLSILRYLVFSVQFLLVFFIFDINLPIHILLLGIFWIFLVKTLTPGISIFSDLAIRELSAVFFFSMWNIGQAEITIATFTIWLVNIIIPALLGVFFIPNLKFNLTKSKNIKD